MIYIGQSYLQSGVSITWRDRLTRAITAKYIANNNFCKLPRLSTGHTLLSSHYYS
jgi:ABC-type uncharacterized transport system fused permease/ATPase subunit